MKTSLQEEVVRRTWWSCRVETHRHQSERVAQECIAKSEKTPTPPSIWTRQLRFDVFRALVVDGKSLADISGLVGLSMTAVSRQVWITASRMKRNSNLPLLFPNHHGIRALRAEKDFWLHQLNINYPDISGWIVLK